MKKSEEIKFLCKLLALACALLVLMIETPLFGISLYLFLILDFINCGPFSIYYEIEWRYKKWRTKEKEHDWTDWYIVNGMRQVRFCKNCGKADWR